MEFKEPIAVYTAANNLEAHMIVAMLNTNDVPAVADEDQSGVSLWAFGTISQFHQPKVWVEKSTAQAATQLILRFEEKNRERKNPSTSTGEVQGRCDECGMTSVFPDSLNGTVQECSHCCAYVDVVVGEPEEDEDFSEADGL